ncbi:MAG: hypothetical protein MUC87_08680 [Bacteroidia bacterium]|jgi:hypothetical protein|nr:hypothetical protein [Bacteroidia bacterium]
MIIRFNLHSLRRCSLLVLLTFLCATGYAQENWEFIFGGRVMEFSEEKQKEVALDMAVITIYKGSAVVSTTNTQSNGKFKCRIPGNGDYTVTVTKGGYITKRFAINTMNVPLERSAFPFGPFDVEVELFKVFPGLDYSVLDKPIARIIYNPAPNVDDFDYDKVYTEKIRAELERLKELARQAREKERLYNEAIQRADKAFGINDFATAKTNYQQALAIKTNEQYPKDQIAECDKKMAGAAAAAAKEQEYKNLIAQADAKFAAKDWLGAKSVYQQASSLKPVEQYPKDRINLCDKNLADAAMSAANDQKYKDLIAQADQKFGTSDWSGAKTLYQQASSLKQSEQYPKDQIAKCDKGIADAAAAAAKEKQFQDLITQANLKFGAKEYAAAKTVYQQALAIKPGDDFATERIAQCDQFLADELAAAEREKQYKALIAQADAKFAAKDWNNAKAIYLQAQGQKPLEKYPKDQIALCEKNAADAAAELASQQKYKDIISQADLRFAAGDWSSAKALYQQALGLKASEQYPKDQIAICDKNIDSAKAAADLESKYKAAIAKGDAAFAGKNYEQARASFVEAGGLKPAEQYPKDKIAAIDKILADKAAADALSKQYNDLIVQADLKFGSKDWASARGLYEQASGLKTNEQYPKDRIKACDDNLAKEKSAAERDSKYKEAITTADAAFKVADYTAAKAAYAEASGLKPAEKYPKDQLAAIAKMENDAANAAALDQKYKDAIAKADAAFNSSDYTGARAAYLQASSLKPAEQYPKDRMAECDKKLGEAKAIADRDTKYKAAIAKGDAAFATKNYNGARTAFAEASALKSDEQYPKDKITEIDRLLADAAALAEVERKYNEFIKQADAKFTAKDWSGARSLYEQAAGVKPALQYPKDRMALCDASIAKELDATALNKKYKEAIDKGDAAFKTSDYETAQSAYNEASGLKPAEKYPKDQLALIAKKLAELEKARNAESSYKNAIARGDSLFRLNDYSNSRTAFVNAQTIKPAEAYPKTKIAEIDKILADQKNAANADKRYTDAIARGDKALAAQDLATAKAAFTEASGLKPNEQYPKDKLAEIDRMLNDASVAAALNKKYADLIKQADVKFTAKDWSGAKTAYTEALGLKPAEQYPQDRIKLCDENIAKAGSLAELNQRYKDVIAKADAAMTASNYTNARQLYNEALGLKPSEAYPKAKLAELDKLAAADAAMIAKEQKYNTAIQTGDSLMALKNYTAAKASYQQAASIKPAEQLPKDRIADVDRILADQKFEADKQKKYDAAITKADRAFAAKDYNTAKTAYNEALAIKPMELYPKQKLAEIDKILNPKTDPVVNNNQNTQNEDVVNELVKKYPQGLTEETEKEGTTNTTKRIVVAGNKAWVYTRKVYSWGGVYYFKDGVQISESQYNYETSPAYIQQLQQAKPGK